MDSATPPPSRQTQVILLLLSLGVIGAAAAGDIDAGQRVRIGPVSLPSVCSFRNIAGIDCAGCGLTRSFILIAHGRIGDAFHRHHLGIPMFLFVAIQIPYRLLLICWPRLTPRAAWVGRIGDYGLLAMVLLMVIDWVARLVMGRV